MLDYSEADRNSKARQVVAAMETVGFMLLENVPGYSEDDLRWCQEFFFDVMPPEKKLEVARVKYNPANKHVVSDIHTVPIPNIVGLVMFHACYHGPDPPIY